MTDVLFIHPSNQRRTYQDLSREFTAIATPAWTCLLAQRMRKLGLSVAIYDTNVEGWDEKVPSELLSKHQPELVVMMVYGHNPSASTQSMPAARRIAGDIKAFNADVRIALGGIHPSALPERTLREEPVDFVIQGEGAYTIDALVGALRGKCAMKDVPGLWWRKSDELVANEPAAIVENLDDELDGYAWDLLPPLARYRAHNMHCFQDFEKSATDDFSDVRSPYVAMNTSLGCPFSCHYCCINAVFGKPAIRYWSVDKVANWLDELAAAGVRNVRFDDELFILSPRRVEEFCDKLIERNLDLNIWVYGRVDTVRDHLLKKLRQAGIRWICLGIESANEKVRADVNKKIKPDIAQVVRQIQDHDIYVLGNYMFGLPEDTMETMEETLQQAMDLNCEFVNFYSVMAYPGSQLYAWAEKQGYLPQNWSCFSQHSSDAQPLPTRHIGAADVLRFRDEAFDRYFSNERYLKMVREKFGPRVEKHIHKMLEIKITRKLTTGVQV